MLELYRNIKNRRIELGMSQEDLAKKTGYTSRSSIAKIEKGEVDLPQSKILAFAKALNMPAGDLMGYENELPSFDNVYMIGEQNLPVLGDIACGKPIEMIEERELYVQVGTKIKADFVLIAKGDSMKGARIEDGDCVFIKQQGYVENGQIAVVAIGDEATLKRCFFYPQKEMLILKAENPKYEDIILMGKELEDCRIIGKAIAFQSDVI